MTLGLEVFVQLVMAAIKTEPWLMEALPPPLTGTSIRILPRSSAFMPKPLSVTGLENAAVNSFFSFGNSMRSCGRFGPATLGKTVPRSSSNSCE